MPNKFAGLTLAKFFNPFYSQARSRFRLYAADVDRLVRAGYVAELDGHTLNFKSFDASAVTEQWRFRINPRQAARWVNDFNARSSSARVNPMSDFGAWSEKPRA